MIVLQYIVFRLCVYYMSYIQCLLYDSYTIMLFTAPDSLYIYVYIMCNDVCSVIISLINCILLLLFLYIKYIFHVYGMCYYSLLH